MHNLGGEGGTRDILLVISISLATFMATLDGSIVNIALPTISESFNLTSGMVSWVSTIYLLVMAGCVLIFGKISDKIGYKRVFLSGFIIFTLGSLFCGVLPDITGSFLTLIGSRAFQGIGGAMISAVAPAMAIAFIPLEKKGRAMGIIMTFSALGTAIGPTIGGLLTQYLSWYFIFLINVPIGIFAVLLGAKIIPSLKPVQDDSKFDRSGAALIFVGLALLLFGVSEAQRLGWNSPAILISLVASVFILGYFVLHELRSENPVLEMRIFRNMQFLNMNVILCLLYFSFSGVSYLLPFYLEYVKGYSTSSAGLILTALSIAMMIAGILAGLLYDKIGGRRVTIIAAAILLGGYFLITHLTVDTSTSFIVLCLGLMGFGLGMLVTPVSNMIMTSCSKKYEGMISSLTCLERFAPLTLGIAFFNLSFIHGMVSIANTYGVTLQSPVLIQRKVLTAGFDLTFLVTFIIGIVIVILTLLIRYRMHPDYENDDRFPS